MTVIYRGLWRSETGSAPVLVADALARPLSSESVSIIAERNRAQLIGRLKPFGQVLKIDSPTKPCDFCDPLRHKVDVDRVLVGEHVSVHDGVRVEQVS